MKPLAEVKFNTEEKEASDHLLKFMDIVIHKWNLYEGNRNEVAEAVHILQFYIIHHMLERLNKNEWSQWYDREEES